MIMAADGIKIGACYVKCGSLKDASKKEDFLEELSEEYEEIREEHYDSLKVKSHHRSSQFEILIFLLVTVSL